MGYTDDPVPRYVYDHGPPDTLQIFSVRVGGSLGGLIDPLHWPLHVFGLVALRDSIDQHRNVIFNRTRDDCQILTEEVRTMCFLEVSYHYHINYFASNYICLMSLHACRIHIWS